MRHCSGEQHRQAPGRRYRPSMRSLALAALLLPGCFSDAPALDEAVEDESSSSEGTEPQESSDGSSGEESSSGGEPVWSDAYGPCDVDTDCPLIPGDDGEFGTSPRCVEGTCAIRCADASGGGDFACPGYLTYVPDSPQAARPIACQDGYCTIQFDPLGAPGSMACPDGMQTGDVATVPDLDCVWEPL